MDLELSGLALSLIAIQKRRKKKRVRNCWAKSWILRRRKYGAGCSLLKELAFEDPAGFKIWMRMDEATFYDLLNRVGPLIKKQDTHLRDSIDPAQRLAVCLRFLATGESFNSLHYTFRMGESTVSQIVHETADAIYQCLRPEYLQVPNKKEDWLKISKEYYDLWQFPNCIGSLDGKHVKIVAPPESGSEFYNHKGFFSVVLMALVNANYEFTYVDVGTNGRISDGGVWGKSALKNAIENGSLDIPGITRLPGSEAAVPHVIVADEAFGLKQYLMRPYPGRHIPREERIFNYRLSRARRIVENAFGILCNRWRFLLSTINLSSIERIIQLVLAACALHNFLCRSSSRRASYMPDGAVDREELGNIIPGSWRTDYPGGTYERPAFGGMRPSATALETQAIFKEYFNNEGAVPWQQDRV